MNVELWLAVSDTARDTLIPLLDDEEYNGPHLIAVKVFRKIILRGSVERMFKKPTIQGKVWHLYSIVFNDLSKDAVLRAKDAIDYLLAEYPSNIQVAGAWKWDGLQVGTSLDENGDVIGTPTYPIHNRLLDFMPDVWDNTDPENPVQVAPTQLTDVRIIQGQSLRRFT